jgi:hypothetical protein
LQKLGPVDLLAFLRAFALLARNPQIALAPLLVAIVQVLLFMLIPADSGAGFLATANSGLAGLFAQLLSSFGLAVALIVADAAWRRGRAPFDAAWEEAQRKAGDILIAALGFTFVIYVAQLVGSIIPLFGAIVLGLVALFFFIYALPAAAIGGVPGGAALQISLERARGAVLPTLLVTALYILTFFVAPTLIQAVLTPFSFGPAFASRVVPSLIDALVRAILSSYFALILAKTYADISFGRRW